MAHHLQAIILKGSYLEEEIKKFDLHPIHLGYDLTMFIINEYYIDYWQEKLGIYGDLNLDESVFPDYFPMQKCLSYIVTQISNKEAIYALIYTDYFGGYGEQFACVLRGEINLDKSIKTINQALHLLGVIPVKDMDEFDSVGLLAFRSEPDYLDKYFME